MPVLAAASDPAPSAHVLLLGVQTGPAALAADAVLAAAAVAYLVAAHHRGRKAPPWPAGATASFLLGLAGVWVAVGSGLAAYDESNVTLHVVQHVLLMMVAAPLLALGAPATLAAQTLGRRHQVRLLAVLRSRPVRWGSMPLVASAVYLASMWAYFLTPAYPYTVGHPLAHDATHVAFLAIGYLYWQPLVGADPSPRPSAPVRLVTIMLGASLEGALGVVVSLLPRPLAPVNTLADTHTAGRAWLMLAMLACGVWSAVVIWQWLAQAAREAPRADRLAREAAELSRRDAEALGLPVPPPGWSVPAAALSAQERRAPGGPRPR
ncbi:MAG TPA: cytochrome c oxidase assembly protein [Acidimicrobiales bacterium]|nr:cytochrome c oxidase assembly protein [Acidimicrobiales bacterium]